MTCCCRICHDILKKRVWKVTVKVLNNYFGGIVMMNPYEKCPVFENENYLIRLIDDLDAPDLLLVYSDEKAVAFFNSDNCGGDDFHMTRLEYV